MLDIVYRYCSVTELSKCGDNRTLSVRGVLEGHVVSGTPGELGANTGEVSVLNVVLRCQVSDLLMSGHQLLEWRIVSPELKHRHLSDVADIPHRFELVEVHSVMNEVEHEVVLHSDIKSLHLLGLSVAGLGDGGFYGVLCGHESIILGFDLVDDAWGVDSSAMRIPINVFFGSRVRIGVVVGEEGAQFCVCTTSSISAGCLSQSSEPNSSEILI